MKRHKYYLNSGAAMRYYMLATQSGEREVGGFFEFEIDEDGNTIILDLTVLRQEASVVHFTIDEKEKAIWLEKIVGEGKNPANFGLFHTHPTGMGSSMSSVDVKQIEEMATDLPGVVARSMILSQGKMYPTVNEAIYIEGRIWRNDDIPVTILDETGAINDLRNIGWFDKPKEQPRQMLPPRVGFSHFDYGSGANRSSGRGYSSVVERSYDANDGWYDEAPTASEQSRIDAYEKWLDSKAEEQSAGYLIQPEDLQDEAEQFIGTEVWYKGAKVTVIDAYVVESDVTLVMPNNDNVGLDEVVLVPEEDQQAAI